MKISLWDEKEAKILFQELMIHLLKNHVLNVLNT